MNLSVEPSPFKSGGVPPRTKLPPLFGMMSPSSELSELHGVFNTKPNSSVKYKLSHVTRSEAEVGGDHNRGSRLSGIAYLRNLPTLLARHRETLPREEDLANRPSFPEGASVSLPTSTTTIEYLLGRKISRASATEETDETEAKGKANHGASPGKIVRSAETSSFLSRTNSLLSRTSSEIAARTLQEEPCPFSHQTIVRVSQILDLWKKEEPKPHPASTSNKKTPSQQPPHLDEYSLMDYLDTDEQVKTLQLAFTVLKFQNLLETGLNHTHFFEDNPQYRGMSSLVCVLLYDLQSHRFLRRTPQPQQLNSAQCEEIREALLDKKTRLHSFISKERVKHNAPTLEHLLPEAIRNLDGKNVHIPLYMWINQLKTSIPDLLAELTAEGFTQLSQGDKVTEQQGKVFLRDSHCSDLLVFPSYLGLYLKESRWVMAGYLVPQDKSSCLAAQSVLYLLATNKDVIHVNLGTGVTAAHLASLLRRKSPLSHVWGFGIDSPAQGRKTVSNMEFLGATKYTKFLVDDFLAVDPDEPKLKAVKVILITAGCSKSAITSPVQFVINEGEDLRVLKELSRADHNLEEIQKSASRHEKLLRHALSFSRVQAVVYTTRSRYELENEVVVTNALEQSYKVATGKGIPFRVTPPVLPFTIDEIDSGADGIDDRYIRFFPSLKSNGCFVAVISREPEDPRDLIRNAISLAKSKSMLAHTQSTPSVSVFAATPEPRVARQNKRGRDRQVKGAVSASEMKPGISSKLAAHKSATAVGARLFQAGLVHKIEQRARQKSNKPDQARLTKHPTNLSLQMENDFFLH